MPNMRQLEKRLYASRTSEPNSSSWTQLTVWPEYNGLSKDEFEVKYGDPLDDATDDEWGSMIAESVDRFLHEFHLQLHAFRFITPTFWQRLLSNFKEPVWQKIDAALFNAEYVNGVQHFGHDPVVFIAARGAVPDIRTCDCRLLESSFRNSPSTVAIFRLGIEESLLMIYFATHELEFMRQCKQIAGSFGHELVETDKPFVSHWVIANQ